MSDTDLDRLISRVADTPVRELLGEALKIGEARGDAERQKLREALTAMADILVGVGISVRGQTPAEREEANEPPARHGSIVDHVRSLKPYIGMRQFRFLMLQSHVRKVDPEITEQQIRSAVKTLRRAGEIKQIERGVYQFPAPDAEVRDDVAKHGADDGNEVSDGEEPSENGVTYKSLEAGEMTGMQT